MDMVMVGVGVVGALLALDGLLRGDPSDRLPLSAGLVFGAWAAAPIGPVVWALMTAGTLWIAGWVARGRTAGLGALILVAGVAMGARFAHDGGLIGEGALGLGAAGAVMLGWGMAWPRRPDPPPVHLEIPVR